MPLFPPRPMVGATSERMVNEIEDLIAECLFPDHFGDLDRAAMEHMRPKLERLIEEGLWLMRDGKLPRGWKR